MTKSKMVSGMGFRDLAMFNDSLLAKQAWWLLNNKTSLLLGFQGPFFPQYRNHGSYRFENGVLCMEEYFDRKGYYPKGVEVEGWKWRKNKHMAAPVVTMKTSTTLAHMPHQGLWTFLGELPNWSQYQTMADRYGGGLFVEEDAEMIKKIPLSQLATNILALHEQWYL